MRLRPATALAAAVALAACAHAPGPVPAPGGRAAARGPGPAEFYPLEVGNSWTYVDESPALAPATRGASRTVRIVEQTADGYFRDSERGELKADATCLHDRVRRILCAPFQQGASWSSIAAPGSTERFEIAAVDETVKTPAGEFRGCVKVRARNRADADTEQVLEITYAPGVGVVRLETFAVVKGAVSPQVRAVLGSYQVKGR